MFPGTVEGTKLTFWVLKVNVGLGRWGGAGVHEIHVGILVDPGDA